MVVDRMQGLRVSVSAFPVSLFVFASVVCTFACVRAFVRACSFVCSYVCQRAMMIETRWGWGAGASQKTML